MKITYTDKATGKDVRITDVKNVNLYFTGNTACVHFNDNSKPLLDLKISEIKHIDND